MPEQEENFMKIDLHTHTIASGHAFSTLQEMVDAALKKQIEVLAITDHGPTTENGNGASEYYFRCGHRFSNIINGVRVLFGVEANIINERGKIDLPKDVLKELDVVMVGFHNYCGYNDLGIEKNTQAMINAMKNPFVKMISHPYSSQIKIDIEKIARASIEHNVLLEINASFFYHKIIKDKIIWQKIKKMVEILKKNKKKIIINSDAHSSFEVGRFEEVKNKLAELKLTENDLLNNDKSAVFKFFGIKN